MDRSIAALTAGLLSELKKLDTTSNNLANLNTPGFVRDETFSNWMSVFQLNARINPNPAGSDALRLQTLLENRNQDGTLVEAMPIMEPAALEHTGDPLDVAIKGDGFFVLRNGDQEIYTRRGRFSIDGEGNLLSTDGLPVMGADGPIRIPNGGGAQPNELTIEPDGAIFNGGQQVGQLKVVRMPEEGRLSKVGDTAFTMGTDVQPAPAGEKMQVVQGYLERSNVSVVKEMTDMISSMRSFETYQKVVQMVDELKGKFIQTVTG
ncbi:MAG: flagellar hook-basal body protein [Deltaproteobacteria bacterium]|nr:flagellar hook-basal body protein [Deltaproteobacteria bacterium]